MGVIVDELCDDTSMNTITALASTSNVLHVTTDLAVCLSVNDVTNGNNIRIRDYFENVIPAYDVNKFRNHFRMRRETVEVP